MFDIIILIDNHSIVLCVASSFLLYVNLLVRCSTVGKLNWEQFGFWFIVLFGMIPGTAMALYAVLAAADFFDFEGVNRKYEIMSILVAGLLLQLGAKKLLSCAKNINGKRKSEEHSIK